jgi:hypothetical protein
MSERGPPKTCIITSHAIRSSDVTCFEKGSVRTLRRRGMPSEDSHDFELKNKIKATG